MKSATAFEDLRRPGAAPAGPRVTPRVRTDSELNAVNKVVDEALGSWGLPERVRRLALPSLLYDHSDLEHMSVVLAEGPDGGVAVAAWESDTSRDAPYGLRSVLLHGLYVTPIWQRRGLGTNLLDFAGHWILGRGFDGITVKAWRESQTFFRRRGFNPLTSFGTAESYPQRMWKRL